MQAGTRCRAGFLSARAARRRSSSAWVPSKNGVALPSTSVLGALLCASRSSTGLCTLEDRLGDHWGLKQSWGPPLLGILTEEVQQQAEEQKALTKIWATEGERRGEETTREQDKENRFHPSAFRPSPFHSFRYCVFPYAFISLGPVWLLARSCEGILSPPGKSPSAAGWTSKRSLSSNAQDIDSHILLPGIGISAQYGWVEFAGKNRVLRAFTACPLLPPPQKSP